MCLQVKKMTDVQLYTRLSGLPEGLKAQVADFIEFLQHKSAKGDLTHPPRKAGKAKGLIEIKENFDDPIEGFEEYL